MAKSFWERMIAASSIGELTVQDLNEGLKGFSLPVDRLERLLADVQLAVVRSERSEVPDNQASKKKLRSVAKSLQSASRKLATLDASTLRWIDLAARSRSPDPGRKSGGMAPPVFPDLERFIGLSDQLRWAEDLLIESSSIVSGQSPRWREREPRDRLKRLAVELAPVFEACTKKRATINNWAEGASLGPWPDFFARITILAFGPQSFRDIRGVLTEADKARQALLKAQKKARVAP